MELEAFIVVAAILNLCIGFFVWRSSKRNPLNVSFGVMSLMMGIWIILNYLLRLFPTIFLFKSILATGPFIIISALVWLGYFKNKKLSREFTNLVVLLSVISVVVACFVFYDSLVISKITTATQVVLGKFFLAYAIYLGILLLGLIGYLIAVIIQSEDGKKKQIKLVGTGMAIFIATVIVVDIILPSLGKTTLSMFDSPSSLIFIGFTAYSILSEHLFEIRLITTEVLLTLLMLIIVTQIIFADSWSYRILGLVLLLPASYIGIQLVNSVKRERAQNLRLERDKEKLLDLDRLKDEFLQMATHELNTPISVIRGRLEMAIDENLCELNPKQKKFLDPIMVDTDRLAKLSKDILNTARIDQHRLTLNLSEVDVNGLITTIVSDLAPKAKEAGTELVYSKPTSSLSKTSADQSKISEVISNLINNAIKFTRNGKITVSATQDGETIKVSVTDNGVGIKQEDQKDLFHKFYQAGRFDPKNPQEQQGTGLGLYISKSIIALHGGEMGLESEFGKGSTFYFTLPIRELPEKKEVPQTTELKTEEQGVA